MAKKCAAKCATHHFGGCRNSHCMLLGARCMQHAVVVRVCICAERSRAMNAILFFGPACILRCCFCVHLFCFVFFLCILLLLFTWFASMMDRVPLCYYYYCYYVACLPFVCCCDSCVPCVSECSPFRALSERNKKTRHVQKFN